MVHAPTSHLAAKQIQHRHHLQAVLFVGDVGDVAAAYLIGRLGREVALQLIWGNRQIVFSPKQMSRMSISFHILGSP